MSEQSIGQRSEEMIDLLRQAIGFQSVSGKESEFTRFIADWAKQQEWHVDLWQAMEADLAKITELPPKFIPLNDRPTLVIGLKGNPAKRSLMFNAHADVVAAPSRQKWQSNPWQAAQRGNRLYGRGACDDKGPLISALWAMAAIGADWDEKTHGDVLLELVPGEEDCVGLGTLTSVARGYRPDASIVLEPTGGLPRCASRGGCRFEITCRGRAVHGTVKWLGEDAILLLQQVLIALQQMENKWQKEAEDPLFAAFPILRPITVDAVNGGVWQGMVCDLATCAGYLELLPRVDRGGRARVARVGGVQLGVRSGAASGRSWNADAGLGAGPFSTGARGRRICGSEPASSGRRPNGALRSCVVRGRSTNYTVTPCLNHWSTASRRVSPPSKWLGITAIPWAALATPCRYIASAKPCAGPECTRAFTATSSRNGESTRCKCANQPT